MLKILPSTPYLNSMVIQKRDFRINMVYMGVESKYTYVIRLSNHSSLCHPKVQGVVEQFVPILPEVQRHRLDDVVCNVRWPGLVSTSPL